LVKKKIREKGLFDFTTFFWPGLFKKFLAHRAKWPKKSKINGFLTFFFKWRSPKKRPASQKKIFFSKNYDFLGFFK